jgi:competence ComEA-like helix-hairpin-helix protein
VVGLSGGRVDDLKVIVLILNNLCEKGGCSIPFSIPLDLNRISLEDLCLIPGIGESLAQEIVVYRERRRRFGSVEELKNVKGIGEKKYKNLKGFFVTKLLF